MTDANTEGRGERARRFDAAAAPMLRELAAAGVDVGDFGLFTTLRPTTFDYRIAAPILIAWLPRIDEPAVVEAIARSLTGQREAVGDGAHALTAAYRRLPADSAEQWAVGNALSTIAGPRDSDDLIALLQDPSSGTGRQMLCDALTRTRDPRAADVLIELIADDDVNGHAILALRRMGGWKTLPQPERTRGALEALLERPSATPLARKQAQRALATI